MTIRGTPRSYYKKFAFVVEIEGVAFAGFQNCSELQAELAVIEQFEGGRLTPNKSPGRVTVSDLTLERGATSDRDLWDWFKKVVDMNANAGLVDDQFKRDLEIVQLDRDGTPLVRWAVYGSWPSTFVAGSWDNDADENVMESVTLTIDTFEPLAP